MASKPKQPVPSKYSRAGRDMLNPNLLSSRRLGLSPAAQAIARLMVETSSQGRPSDPQLSPEHIMLACCLGVDDVIDGADELEAFGLVRKYLAPGVEHFVALGPDTGFFPAFDRVFGTTDPETDARHIATDLVNSGTLEAATGQLATVYGWSPRRMNPAIEFLLINNLAMALEAIDSDWSSPYVIVTPLTHWFAGETN